MGTRNINRIRVIIAEQNRTNKWLAEQIGVSETTVSRWVNNAQQPKVEIFLQIADLMKVDIRDLFEPSLNRK